MARTPCYITEHQSGGYKYQKWIPAELHGALKKRMFVRYLKRMPRREAEAIARAWAVQDDAEIAALRDIGPWRGFMAAPGKSWREIMTDPAYRVRTSIEPDGTQVTRTPALDNEARKWLAISIDRKVNKPKASFDALYQEWMRIRTPGKPRNHLATIELLKKFFGAAFDCRNLTPQDIAKFRDSLQCSRGVLERHLHHIHGMFNAAIREHTSPFFGMINPATGVKVLGKAPPKKDGADKVFTALQVKTILETAAATKFGRKRHTEILWALRVLFFTGARINEIFQLQGGDILEVDGVKCIKIHGLDAVTGEPHPEKSTKNKGSSRLIPIHSMIADFYDYAQTFAKSAFIFGAFPFNATNGRAAWLVSFFPKFLRECGIIEPTKRLQLYGTRHTFISAMRIAGVPEDVRMVIVGHSKTQHQHYGDYSLPILRDYINSVKPLG